MIKNFLLFQDQSSVLSTCILVYTWKKKNKYFTENEEEEEEEDRGEHNM